MMDFEGLKRSGSGLMMLDFDIGLGSGKTLPPNSGIGR